MLFSATTTTDGENLLPDGTRYPNTPAGDPLYDQKYSSVSSGRALRKLQAKSVTGYMSDYSTVKLLTDFLNDFVRGEKIWTERNMTALTTNVPGNFSTKRG